jgi:hypothetical protein
MQVTFRELIKKIQKEAVQCEPFHYTPLTDIQSAAGTRETLIDHLLVFANYPTSRDSDIERETAPKDSGKPNLTLAGKRQFEQSNYDLNVGVVTDDQFYFLIRYNANSYDRKVLETLVAMFERVLDQVLAKDTLTIGELEFFSAQEKNKMLDNIRKAKGKEKIDKPKQESKEDNSLEVKFNF